MSTDSGGYTGESENSMIAAIYARKSTEQTGTAEEAKSVTRQIDHARAYAAMKGWTVAEAHVYVDDGISGAEFAKRSGLVRLINALTPRPPFQVLVMSEESRLGREQIETAYLLKQLITAGVRVFYYLEETPPVGRHLRRRDGAGEGPRSDAGCDGAEGPGRPCDGRPQVRVR
jgi:DNA invertase Pin-like site-specific DNA recombinase